MMQMKRKALYLAVMLAVGGCATTEQPAPTQVPETNTAAQMPPPPAPEPEPTATAIPLPETAEAEAVPTPEPIPEPEEVAEQGSAEPAPAMDAAAPSPAVDAAPAKEAAAAATPPPVPQDPNTFVVTSTDKGPDHPYKGQGSEMGFVVNGQPGKPLVLTRGETYQFKVDTGVQHDFYFTTAEAGWGAGTVTDGVEGQFTYQGTVTFTPGSTTPDELYYECRNHKYMGGKIFVVDPGESVDPAVLQAAAEPAGGAKRQVVDVSADQVRKKLGYARMVANSEAAKRVDASGNGEAKSLMQDAAGQLSESESALQAGDAGKALAAVDEALRLMSAATRLVPADTAGTDQKAKYEHLLSEVRTYEDSYKRHAKLAERKKDQLSKPLDQAKFAALVNDAENDAAKGDYEAAVKRLTQASSMVQGVLSVMLDNETVVYDKNFETPEDEYRYELARNESYAELIPLAIEQKNPSQRLVDSMRQFVDKSKSIVSQAKALAGRGDYANAVMALQAATENLQRALMIAGVR